jgi:hypothetical protein
MSSVKLEKLSLSTGGVHFFVEAEINGRPARLLVDTGASHSVVGNYWIISTGQFNGVTASNAPVIGLASTENSTARRLKISSILIDGRKIPKASLFVVDLSHLNEQYPGRGEIDGLLGSDLLSVMRAEIDLRALRLKF